MLEGWRWWVEVDERVRWQGQAGEYSSSEEGEED
jgi:hypothetical protein